MQSTHCQLHHIGSFSLRDMGARRQVRKCPVIRVWMENRLATTRQGDS